MVPAVKRMNADRWRGVIVAVIVALAVIGIWREGTRVEETNPSESCWLEGVPRYPGARLDTVLHDQRGWHASLDTKDSREQVIQYYSEQLAPVEKGEDHDDGRYHWTSLTGMHPAGYRLFVSVMEDQPEKSEWKLASKIDLGTKINVMVIPPTKPAPPRSWPFGPDHPKHTDWPRRMTELMRDFVSDDGEQEP